MNTLHVTLEKHSGTQHVIENSTSLLCNHPGVLNNCSHLSNVILKHLRLVWHKLFLWHKLILWHKFSPLFKPLMQIFQQAIQRSLRLSCWRSLIGLDQSFVVLYNKSISSCGFILLVILMTSSKWRLLNFLRSGG
jgi:hypothetical protein